MDQATAHQTALHSITITPEPKTVMHKEMFFGIPMLSNLNPNAFVTVLPNLISKQTCESSSSLEQNEQN